MGMKSCITATTTAAILGWGAAFAAGSAGAHAGGHSPGVCNTGQVSQANHAGTQQSRAKCRAAVARAYLAYNENRHATDADLGG